MKTSLRMGILGLSTVAIGLSFQLALEIAKPQFNVQREIASTYPAIAQAKPEKKSTYSYRAYPAIAQMQQEQKSADEDKAENFVEHNSEAKKEKKERPLTDYEKRLHKGLDKHFKSLGLTLNSGEKKNIEKESHEVGKYTVLKVVDEKKEKTATKIVGKDTVLKAQALEEEVIQPATAEANVEDSQVADLQSSLCQRENELDKLSEELEETRQSLDDVLAKLDSRAPAIDAPNYQMEDITAMFGEMMTTIMQGFSQQQAQASQVVQMHNPLQDIVMQNLLYRANAERSSIMPEAAYRVNTYNNYYGNVQQYSGQQMNNQQAPRQMNSLMPQQQQMTPGFDWRTEQDILSQGPQVPQVAREQMNTQSHIQL